MSLLLAVFASMSGTSALSNISLSAAWNDISLVGNPPPPAGFTGARTLTWTGGGSRNISVIIGVDGTILYNINSTGYVAYTGPFTMTSGQTLQFRYARSTFDDFGSVTVLDQTNSNATVGSFTCSTTYTGGQ